MMHGMDTEVEDEEIYANADPMNLRGSRTETKNSRRDQTPQHTERHCVRMSISRAVSVCLAVLCFLLLAVVIVLYIYIYTNNLNYTQERNQLLTRISNITEEKDELLTKNILLTKEKNELSLNNSDLVRQRDELHQQKNELLKMDGWTYYQSSLYFISSESKSWTESRRYCTERGTDLIIINNIQEQEFVKKTAGAVWIGLTDSKVEGIWKWVDGSELTLRFWDPREPNGGRGENCALNYSSGWGDYPCSSAFNWICERNIHFKIIT